MDCFGETWFGSGEVVMYFRIFGGGAVGFEIFHLWRIEIAGGEKYGEGGLKSFFF